MNEFSMRFSVPDQISAEQARHHFYWPTTGNGSFYTSLTPRLGGLGPVRALNADLVRLAVMVYAADRSVLRASGTVNWTRRDITLTTPVSDPKAWTSISDQLTHALGFLSGDDWNLKFTNATAPKETAVKNQDPTAKKIVLLSGGADSAIGALLARAQPDDHVLFSHYGANGIGAGQRAVAAAITALLPDGSSQQHRQVGFRRMQRQPDGTKFKNEYSTRTRSLLFLALGLALASINEVPLWIPENGFASLNPPMGADQLGSISTKTTHPWFLSELASMLAKIGAQGDIENPFADKTKGEMFQWVADEVGKAEASKFLSLTESCGFTNKRFLGVEKAHHCGSCFGCLMRRASFAAAKIEDRSTYAVDNPPNERAREVLAGSSLLPSIRAFVARGVTVSDIAAMRLPAGYAPGSASDLCQRGADELSALV